MKNFIKNVAAVIIVSILFTIFLFAIAEAGTDKDAGTVCQGSTCSTSGAVGDISVTALGGSGGTSNSNSSSSAAATGGNSVANGGNASSNSVGLGGSSVVTNNVNNKVTNNNANLNNNKVKNTNKNTNTNNIKNTNSNRQSQNNNQSIAPVQNVITESNRLAAPSINSAEVPILQGGKIGDVTAALPDFFGIQKLAQGEKIVKVIKVLNGSWFTKIRLEDVPEAILEGVPAGSKVRYSVWAKDGVTAVTTGGGIAASQSVGANAATGSILPGWASSNANPVFVIFVYEVK